MVHRALLLGPVVAEASLSRWEINCCTGELEAEEEKGLEIHNTCTTGTLIFSHEMQ